MSPKVREIGSGFPSATLLQKWLSDYSRGEYIEVVQLWVQVGLQAPHWDLARHPRHAEAVGWSLALTKQWSHFKTFCDQLADDPSHQALIETVQAWRGIHDARYDASLHAARRTRAALQKNPAYSALAHTLKVEGVALFRLGRYAEAEPLMKQATALFRVIGDTLHVSHCCTNLGLILNARGEIRAAREALHESLAILKTLDAAEERLALARENLAMIELHLGNEAVARQLLESALDVFRSLGLRSEQVTAWNGLGHCARISGNLNEAVECYQQSLALADELPRQKGLGLEFLGQAYFDQEYWQQAETCYREAHEIAANIAPDGDVMVEVCWRLSELLTVTGRLDESEEYLRRAEQLCEAHDDRREWGCVLRAQGRLHAARGNKSEAETFLTRAIATLEDSGRLFEATLTRLVLVSVCDDSRSWLDTANRFLVSATPAAATSHWLELVEALRAPSNKHNDSAMDTNRWGFITRDRDLLRVLREIPTMAQSTFPVLIQGESGTGKELLARAVHQASGRTGAFIAVNCAAIPHTLFESEIFGHAKGAFSGAQGRKVGLFEQAQGGTLMLDEIGEMPLEMQAKLLRVLDDGRVRRVGEVHETLVDCKVVAASNRPLRSNGVEGVFRADLFHRLSVHQINIKPLRERRDDIAPLVQALLQQHGLEGKLTLTPELLTSLQQAAWPGNVRELRNQIVRYALHPDTIAVEVMAEESAASNGRTLRDRRSDHERDIIVTTLQGSDWNVAAAAQHLDMHATTLRRKMRRLEVRRPA